MSKKQKLDRDELIRLVHHIMVSSGCITDVDGLIEQFERSVPYPDAGGLIFAPPSGKRMSAEEIVDMALNG